MLALIDYKYVRFYPFRRAPKPQLDTVFGLRVIRQTAIVSKHGGRCGKSVKALKKTDADMACFSENFPVQESFPLREPVFSIAYEHLLPSIIDYHGFEGETALLVAGADPRSAEILGLLSQRYRYVLTLGVPEKEIQKLRRTTGASVIAAPSAVKISEAELAVFLRAPGETLLSSSCIALTAQLEYLEHVTYSRYVTPPEFDTPGESPEGFSRAVLLSEAIRRGAVAWNRVLLGSSQILTK